MLEMHKIDSKENIKSRKKMILRCSQMKIKGNKSWQNDGSGTKVIKGRYSSNAAMNTLCKLSFGSF